MRTNRRIKKSRVVPVLSILLCVSLIGLLFLGTTCLRLRNEERDTRGDILTRAVSEASNAKDTVYRLTQSSGSNAVTYLSTLRGHIYALHCLNMLVKDMYGTSTVVCDAELVATGLELITQCEQRMQAGAVVTDLYSKLRDNVEEIANGFGEY